MRQILAKSIVLLLTVSFLTGCSFTKKVEYHEPSYYAFSLNKVELAPIETLTPKGNVIFSDESEEFVLMPTSFYVKMLDLNDVRKRYLVLYKKLYGWALEDVERYDSFVVKQKEAFRALRSK